jgi:hypothetical protein
MLSFNLFFRTLLKVKTISIELFFKDKSIDTKTVVISG